MSRGLAFVVVLVLQTTGASRPAVVWARTFRSAAFEYECKRVAASGDGAWVVVGTRPRGSLGGPQRFELWRLDADGNRVGTLEVSTLAVSGRSDARYRSVHGLAVQPTGEAVLLLESEGSMGFVVVAPPGRVTRQVEIPVADGTVVSDVSAANGGILVVGGRRGRGWVLELDASGRPLADTTIDAVPMIDHAVKTKSDYVAVATVLRGATSDVWIGRIAPRGAVLAQRTSQGVIPDVTIGTSGDPILVFAKNTPSARAVDVQRLTSDLAPAWSVTVVDGVGGMREPVLAAIGDDALIASEGTRGSATLHRVDRRGTVLWSFEYREADALSTRFANATAAQWNADQLVGITLTVVEPVENTFEQRQIVRLFRLAER